MFLPKWLSDYIDKKIEALSFVSRAISSGYGWSYRVVGRKLFVAVCIVICLWATLDFLVLKKSKATEERTFDRVMRMRWNEPKASTNIVIIDIDEKSLSEMAGEFGRWPWPRVVFGNFITQANQLGAKALVFDIVFSDPDKFNLKSDATFNAALENAPNVFLPVIRLNEDADRQSKLRASQIPGLQKFTEQPADKTIGLVWPAFLPAAVANGNFGMINLIPANDGITRDYRLFTNEGGYRLPSMALKVAEDVADVKTNLHQQQIRINWRGQKSGYTQIPFSELFAKLRSGDQSAKALVENKILIIGTTAPALFDQKAVPIASVYPGVKIVANAIDNLISGDSIRQLPSWLSYLIALLFVILLCTLLTLGVRPKLLDKVFGTFQLMFLGVTLAVINYSYYYVDLSMPFYYGLTAYAIMRTYILAGQQYAKGKGFFKLHLPKQGPFTVSVAHLLLSYCGEDQRKKFVQLQVARELIKDVTLNNSVRTLINERPMDMDGMFSKLFENRMFIMHIVPETSDAGSDNAWANELLSNIREKLERAASRVEVCLEAVCSEQGAPDNKAIYDVARRLLGRALTANS